MWLEKLNLTVHCAGDDETRAHLHNLCVRKDGVYSTDGHRLMFTPLPTNIDPKHCSDVPWYDGIDNTVQLEPGEQILLPVEVMKQIGRLLSTHKIKKMPALVSVDVVGWRQANEARKAADAKRAEWEAAEAAKPATERQPWTAAPTFRQDAWFRVAAWVNGSTYVVRVKYTDEFPTIDAVIPKGDAKRKVGINPNYLGHEAAQLAAYGKSNNSVGVSGMMSMLELFDEEGMAPIKLSLVRVSGPRKAGAELPPPPWVIIMPMRLG